MQNVGTLDRVIRVIIGLVLLATVFLPGVGAVFGIGGLGAWKWLVALVGAVALVTGLLSTCPLYTVLGVRTCPAKKR